MCRPADTALEPDAGEPRQTFMNKMPGRAGQVRAALAALPLTAAAIAACGSAQASPGSGIPPEFRAACGHPGTHVTARRVPVTIPHAQCDLTGVVITYPPYAGATVPRGGISVANSSGFSLTVDPGTLNVTVNAKGPPGNA